MLKGADVKTLLQRLSPLAVIAAVACPGSPARASESYDNCTGFITSLPTTITTQGVWCLKGDLATSISGGAAITVAASNVTIDCNDFKLGGLAAGIGTQAVGILIANRANSIVRHCNIRGFRIGLDADQGGGHLVEGNRFVGNTEMGLRVASDGSLVRENLIVDTGGAAGVAGVGMTVANGTNVIGNTISGVTTTTEGLNARGIHSVDNDFAAISGNRISGLVAAEGGSAFGISAGTSLYTIIQDNLFFGTAAAAESGILCQSNTSSAIRNSFVAIESPIISCMQTDNAINLN